MHAYDDINPQMLVGNGHIHVPAMGGIDLTTAKSLTRPGTLLDCMNYEVELESGYKQTDGIMLFANRGFDLPTRWLKGTVNDSDSTLATGSGFIVGGIYSVGVVRDGSAELDVGTAKVLLTEIDGSTWETVYFRLNDTNDLNFSYDEEFRIYIGTVFSSDYVTFSSIVEQDSTASTYRADYKKIVNDMTSGNTKPTGSGPITGLFFFDDKLYAARDNGSGSLLYESADLAEITATPDWTAVDMGMEVKFKDGEFRPLTYYDRDFVEAPNSTPTAVGPNLGTITETVKTSYQPNAWIARWDSMNNALEKSSGDGTDATCITRGLSTQWSRTQQLVIKGFNIGGGLADDADITGIEVKVRYGSRAFGSFNGGSEDSRLVTVTLVGVGGADNKAASTSLTPTDGPVPTNYTDYTYGGSSDLWNAAEATSSNVFSDDFGVAIAAEGYLEFPSNVSIPGVLHSIVYVEVTVTMNGGTQALYFWDGSSDVSTATLVNIGLTSGSFGFDNAAGYMALYDVTSAGSISVDDEIRTGASGGGKLVALVDEVPTDNVLPDIDELEAEDGRMVTKEMNFFIDEKKEAIYGATAAGPAFHFNGTHFWNIHAPVEDDQDKPRYVERFNDSLVLAYDAGSILLSAPGQPSNISGLVGASESGFGSKITGLMAISGSALGIWTEDSIEALVGTGIRDYTTQTLAESGALNYTVQDIGQPVFVDYRGVSNLQASSNYGDFTWGRLSHLITKDIQPRIQGTYKESDTIGQIRFAMPVKSKNQYRIYFDNGDVITMTMSGADGSLPEFTKHNYGRVSGIVRVRETSATSTGGPQGDPDAIASITFNNSGQVLHTGTSRSTDYNWLSGAADPADYEMQVASSTGSALSSITGWETMDQDIVFSKSVDQAGGGTTATFDLEIRDADTQKVLDTGTITLEFDNS